jgi:Peptide methionine sulfoxide reductase
VKLASARLVTKAIAASPERATSASSVVVLTQPADLDSAGVSPRVGYSGGDVKNATYRNHGTHAEAIEITFDPSQTSFRDLLEFFFQIHDPTTPNRHGND